MISDSLSISLSKSKYKKKIICYNWSNASKIAGKIIDEIKILINWKYW